MRHDNPLTFFDAFCYTARMSTTSLRRSFPVRRKNEPCCAPGAEPSLTQRQSEELAARLKSLADPTRLRLLDTLAQQPVPLCVCDLTPQFSQNQPTISHHLKLLREAGLIACEKRGIWTYYWATSEGQRSLKIIAALL